MDGYHIPVLLQPVGTYMEVKPDNYYIDATLGGGGHTAPILAGGGWVLGLDQDPEALSACPDSDHLIKVRSNFIHLLEVAGKNHWPPVSGILFDLGVSWHQLTTASRGFSFQVDGPLDMRMDPTIPVTAGDLVNGLPARDLAKIIADFGGERQAGRIAGQITRHRPLSTTLELAAILPAPSRRRVFQALRIAVNDELGALETALPQALELLRPGGRLLVISFHSLEDRLVKQTFKKWKFQNLGTNLTSGPVIPDMLEIGQNPKSQSAKLRVFQKKYV